MWWEDVTWGLLQWTEALRTNKEWQKLRTQGGAMPGAGSTEQSCRGSTAPGSSLLLLLCTESPLGPHMGLLKIQILRGGH
jgi:hypothetical protein